MSNDQYKIEKFGKVSTWSTVGGQDITDDVLSSFPVLTCQVIMLNK